MIEFLLTPYIIMMAPFTLGAVLILFIKEFKASAICLAIGQILGYLATSMNGMDVFTVSIIAAAVNITLAAIFWLIGDEEEVAVK